MTGQGEKQKCHVALLKYINVEGGPLGQEGHEHAALGPGLYPAPSLLSECGKAPKFQSSIKKPMCSDSHFWGT